MKKVTVQVFGVLIFVVFLELVLFYNVPLGIFLIFLTMMIVGALVVFYASIASRYHLSDDQYIPEDQEPLQKHQNKLLNADQDPQYMLNITNEIERLGELRDKGLLTQDEFQKKKEELLDRI